MTNQTPSLRIGLLDNSVHSLKRGYEMWSQWEKTEDAWLLKESIIWVHHGIELVLKQLLAQTNPFLIFENVDKAVENLSKLRKLKGMDKAGVMDLFDNSDRVKSVGFENLIERAAVALSIPELAKDAPLRQKIDELTKYRNKIVHFSIELNIATIAGLLSEILDPLLLMLEREVKDEYFVQNRILEIRNAAQPVKKFSEQIRQEIVANAVKATENALVPQGNRRAGIVWQTLGTGLRKTLIDYLKQVRQIPKVKQKQIIVVADRIALVEQMYHLISDALPQENTVIVKSGTELEAVLETQYPKIIVSTVQQLIVDQVERDNEFLIIAYNLRGLPERLSWSFPKATYILFTGTPPLSSSRIRLFFGDLIGKYDLLQAIDDGMALPVFLENRQIEKSISFQSPQNDFDLDLDVSFDSKIFTAEYVSRLSEDMVQHFMRRQTIFLGKGLIVVPDIVTGIALSDAIRSFGSSSINSSVSVAPISSATHPQSGDEILRRFKSQEDTLNLVVVTGSFLLGFDNPLIHTIYVTCPVSQQLRFHLMSILSRMYEGKKDGLVVDYVGLNWNLEALV